MKRFLSKHRSKIFGTISFLGFLLLFGTLDAIDYTTAAGTETMTYTEIIVRFIIGLIMFGGGAKLSGVMDFDRDNKDNKREGDNNGTILARKVKGSKRLQNPVKRRSA